MAESRAQAEAAEKRANDLEWDLRTATKANEKQMAKMIVNREELAVKSVKDQMTRVVQAELMLTEGESVDVADKFLALDAEYRAGVVDIDKRCTELKS